MIRLSRWPDLPFRTKGLVVVAVPAAATIVIACASYLVERRAAEAEREVNQSFQVGGEIGRLKASEVEASAYAREYFTTREESFAVQARQSMAAFEVARQNLASLTITHPAAGRPLGLIATLERSRVGALSSLQEAETERQQIETILKAMEEEENGLLKSRLRRVDALRAGLRGITAICVLLGVAGGVVISILFASGITNRIGKLQENVTRLATGGILDPLPAGRDEIGALSEGVATTAEILRHRTAALENASHGIAEADAGGRYVSFNRAYSQLTELRDGVPAPSVVETVHPDDRSKVEEAVGRMRECGRAEVEARVVHPGERVAHIGITFVPVSEKRDGGYFVFLRDISRRKEAEAALVQAKDAAVASGFARSEFLAKISHDIRTPLNAILGAVDLLAQSPLESDQAEYVGMFQRNCRRLVALINDFLDFSKVEAGLLRVENLSYRVRETVEEAVATFRDSAGRKDVTLAAEIGRDVPEWELGDPLRVHQVLVNLLSNAIKFTERGRIDVNVQKIASAKGEQLRFTVSDTGPGIQAQDQQRIFAVFAQSEKQDLSTREGCGLGLAICRELVELMGGTIGVTSQAGSGSMFHFTLPLVAARAGVAGTGTSVLVPGPQRPGHETATRILVAEDTEDNRVLLAHYFRGEPVEVQFVGNGQEAVDAIRRGKEFDLVLMDIDMPVLDGLAATRAIRAWESEHGLNPTPIIGLSAHAMREAVRDCLDAGCCVHVAKPVDRATMLSAIRRYARCSRRAPGASIGNSEQVAALVPRYLASKTGQIEEARARLAAKDFEPIRRFGHNLKGTGPGYGIARIEEIGTEIEKAALDGDEHSISLQLEALGRLVAEEHAAATGGKTAKMKR